MQAKDTAQSSSGKLHGLGHRLARPVLGCRPGEMVLFPMTHATMSHPHAAAFWSINKHWVAGQQQTKWREGRGKGRGVSLSPTVTRQTRALFCAPEPPPLPSAWRTVPWPWLLIEKKGLPLMSGNQQAALSGRDSLCFWMCGSFHSLLLPSWPYMAAYIKELVLIPLIVHHQNFPSIGSLPACSIKFCRWAAACHEFCSGEHTEGLGRDCMDPAYKI